MGKRSEGGRGRVPYCITIDYTTLEDDTVTVRDRDTTKQVRKKIGDIG